MTKDDKTNVTALPGVNIPVGFKQKDWDLAISEITKMIPGLAEVYWKKYTALKKEGFQPAQAMEIIIKRGPFDT